MSENMPIWFYSNYSSALLETAERLFSRTWVIPLHKPDTMFTLPSDSKDVQIFASHTKRYACIRPVDWEWFCVYDSFTDTGLMESDSMYKTLEMWANDIGYRCVYGFYTTKDGVRGKCLLKGEFTKDLLAQEHLLELLDIYN